MNRHLVDIKSLLALLDPLHIFHNSAHVWLQSKPRATRLLTSPIIQNGALRIASQPKYPSPFGTAQDVRKVLQQFCNRNQHEFCPDDVSLLDGDVLLEPKLLTPSLVTDLYLVALAVAHQARLATFDGRIPAHAVSAGPRAIELIA